MILPGTDITLPPIAVSAMYWGTRITIDHAHRLLDHAVDAGAHFVDTADNYAFWQTGGMGGESESCLGTWFATRGPASRDRVTVATKVGARPASPGGWPADISGLSRDAVFSSVRASLERLRTDRVELVYAHLDDRAVAMAETVEALQEVVARGWARAYGLCNLTADRFDSALAAVGTGPPPAALQGLHTLLVPAPDVDIAPQVALDEQHLRLCRAAGVIPVASSTLLQENDTRDLQRLTEAYEHPVPTAFDRPGIRRLQQTVADVATRTGLSAGQVVLAWLAGDPDPVLPVVGISETEQVDAALRAVTTELPAEDRARLDTARAELGHA
ncbi:aldo/keto reductase [Propionibacteriaceae bacterium Y2011]|uniref:aldo/keto reductase n=1 Tax=Microlunatus sp. Y2014 TaxID=3418488 RepID=UPI003B484C03